MNETTSPNNNKSFWKKRWVIISLVFLSTLTLFLLLLPTGIRYGLEWWLVKNGAQSAEITKVRLNPFTLKTGIDGLKVKFDDNVVLGDDSLHLDLNLLSLFKKEGFLKTGTLTGLILDVQQFDNGSWRIGSITTKPSDGSAISDEPTPAQQQGDGGWLLRFGHVELADCLLRLTMPTMQKTVQIEHAVLQNLSTGPSAEPGSLKLQAKVNDASVNLDLQEINVNPSLVAKGAVKIDGYKLDSLQELLKDVLSPFAGIAGIDGNVDFTLSNQGEIAVGYDGTIQLEQGNIANDSFSTISPNINFSGTVRYDQAQEEGINIDVDGLLQGESFKLGVPPASLTLDEELIKLDGHTQVRIHGGVEVTTDSGLSLSNLNLELPMLTVAHQGLDWKGQVRYALLGKENKQEIRTKGNLHLITPHYGSGEELSLETGAEKLGWQGQVDIDLGGAQTSTILVDGALDGEGYNLQLGEDVSITQKTLLLDGKTNLSLGEPFHIAHHGRKLELKGSDVTAAGIHNGLAGLSWQGKLEYVLGKNDSTLRLDGTLDGKELAVQLPELLELSEESLELSGTTSVTLAPTLDVLHEGSLKLGLTEVQQQELFAAGQSLNWLGTVGYHVNSRQLEVDGTLQAEELQADLKEQDIAIRQQGIELTAGDIFFTAGDTLQLVGKASLAAKGLQVDQAEAPLLTLEQLKLNELAGSTEKGVTVKDITLQNLAVPSTEDRPIAVEVPQFSLVSLKSPDFTEASIETVTMPQATVRNVVEKTLLAELADFRTSQIIVDKQGRFSLAAMKTGKSAFFQQEEEGAKPQMTLNSVRVKDISWSTEDGFFSDQIILDTLHANYVREKSEERPDAKEKVEEKEEQKGNPPKVRINTIALSNSSASITDLTTSSPFRTELILETATARDINFNEPEKPFHFHIKGLFDKYANLKITGACAPFAETFLLEVKTEIDNYSLQRLSPYLVDSIGTSLVQGQLHLDSELEINGKELEVANQIRLQQIKAQTARKELQQEFSSKLPVPLDTALSMLRDSKGDVDLSIPISGTLDDLAVNPTDILVTALSKAIVIGVTPYLAYTVLGPTGALAYLGLQVGQALLTTSLPDLVFADGEDTLTDEHKKILEKVGKTIQNDKEKSYSICSRVSVWELADNETTRDFDGQQKILANEDMRLKLYELAGNRAETTKNYLAENFSIDQARLQICSSTINFDPNGHASVSFLK